MIKTNSAGRKLYNKLRVSDGVILARNVLYPNAVDDAPIEGDDGTIKFLSIDEDATPIAGTDYDERYFSIVTTEGPVEGWQTAPAPLYRIAKVPTKRALDEIKANAANEEQLVRNQLAPPSQVNGNLSILIVALSRQINGLSLTQAEQDALDLETKRASVFLDNQANLKQIQSQIDLGQTPDLSAGFKTEIPA